MDPFTEKLLTRTRQRRENLARKLSVKEDESPTSALPTHRKRASPLSERSSNRFETDGETPTKRVAPSPPKSSAVPSDMTLPNLRSRLGKLAARQKVWTGDEDVEMLPSPHRSERTPPCENLPPQPAARKSRLAALASTINNWEDDLQHSSPGATLGTPKSFGKKPVASPRSSVLATRSAVSSTVVKPVLSQSPTAALSPTRSALSPARYTRSETTPDNTHSRTQSTSTRFKSPSERSPLVNTPPVRPATRAHRRSVSASALPSLNEPTTRSVSDRLGMWEKRVQAVKSETKTTPEKPKSNPSWIQNTSPLRPATRSTSASNIAANRSTSNSNIVASPVAPPKPPRNVNPHSVAMKSPGRSPGRNASPAKSPAKSPGKVSERMKQLQQSLIEKTQTSWKQNEINNKVLQQKEKDMQVVMNRWEQNVNKNNSKEVKTEETPRTNVVDNDDDYHVVKPQFSKDAFKKKSATITPDQKNMARTKMRSEFENKLSALGFEMSDSPSGSATLPNRLRQQTTVKTTDASSDNSRVSALLDAPVTRHSIKNTHTEQVFKPPIPAQQKLPNTKADSKLWARVKCKNNSDQPSPPELPSAMRRRFSARKAYEEDDDDESGGYRVRFSKTTTTTELSPPPTDQDTTEDDSDFSESHSYLHIGHRVNTNVLNSRDEAKESDNTSTDVSSIESDATSLLGSIEMTMGESSSNRNKHYDSSSAADDEGTEGEDDCEENTTMKAEELCAEMDDLLDSMESCEDDTDDMSTGEFDDSSFISSNSEKERSQPFQRYSVNAYRSVRGIRDQPPARQTIVRAEPEPEPMRVEAERPRENIDAKIRKLNDLVKQEQAIIIQTSNALNQCCAKNSIFAGSQEQVECNRLLLVACQRRQGYIEEIDRLRREGCQRLSGACRGSLTISDIRLPLKREFLSRIGSKQDNTVHYFILLLRNGPHLIVTEMVSSHDGGVRQRGALEIPNLIKLNDIGNDFNFLLEIYSMSIVRELEQEKTKKSTFTPKKLLSKKSKHSGNPVTAMSVSTTNFRLISTVPITLKSIHNSAFNLSRVPNLCPLQGFINMKLRCVLESSVEYRGFLTMFEDVSGFGAWHRRWCVIQNNKVMYWKYPDDEKTKEPMGTIDLKICITDTVGLISRDICARPNTFEIVTVRPPSSGDRNTLVSWRSDTITKFKHMLSADTKADRILWCDKLTQALRNIRTWQPDALPAMKT